MVKSHFRMSSYEIMFHRFSFVFLLFLWLVFFGSGCQPAPISEGVVPMTIQLTSSAFQEGGAIPKKYTCDGQNISPQLDWSGLPAQAKSLVLVVDDPDAPGGTFVHWVLYGLPADLKSLPEGASTGVQGVNDFRKNGYGGPCPPKGNPHRYYFKLYALDMDLSLKPGASKADVEKAVRGHILAQGQLMGKYGR
jgi:Raf kinase inhibitor-like YbhB/YbcL family protein